MRIGIATDHGGFNLKQELLPRLESGGHEVVDFGAHSLTPDDDYPDFVIPLAKAVAAGKVDRGVAVCGSGVGATVCANKVKGVRACLIEDHFSARQGVEDDDLNLICLGGRIEGPELAWDLIQAFLAAEFSRAPRHMRRLQKSRPWKRNQPWNESERTFMSDPKMEQLAINTIRTLSIDAVQAAKSGHPGTPMALAPLVYTIWNRVMRFDPQDPIWPNRDRFVLVQRTRVNAAMVDPASYRRPGRGCRL